jgi:hypothetical protein
MKKIKKAHKQTPSPFIHPLGPFSIVQTMGTNKEGSKN